MLPRAKQIFNIYDALNSNSIISWNKWYFEALIKIAKECSRCLPKYQKWIKKGGRVDKRTKAKRKNGPRSNRTKLN